MRIGQTDFVPNSLNLNNDIGPSFILLTGPNMGGKSTLLRHIALIVILSQLGVMIPGKKVELSIFTSLLTRIGANDSIIHGKSTFMNELIDTNRILSNASGKSLIIIDELGRGSSNTEGTSIAAAVLYTLAGQKKAIGLFATHLHCLANIFASQYLISSKHMSYIIQGDDLVFLYKLVKDHCPKSFGIEVASKIGIPMEITERAYFLLKYKSEHESKKKSGFFDEYFFKLNQLINFQ